MTDIKASEQPKILNSMIEALAQASGGCAQMTHHRGDPRWIAMRQTIELVRDACISQATFQASKVTAVKPW